MRVEGYNFDIRKHVLEYDDVVNKQREVIYNQRRQILSEPTMRPTIMGMVEDEMTVVGAACLRAARSAASGIWSGWRPS